MSKFISTSQIKPIAQVGLIAKGIVYSLLGVLAFMAAFNIGNQSAGATGKEDVLGMIGHQTGGQIMLAVLGIGLLCYTIWRGVQSFGNRDRSSNDAKGVVKRGRYFFSGLVYLALAFYAFKILFAGNSGGKNDKQGITQQVLNQPFGQWLLGIVAVIIIGIGLYQCFYGLSEKYRKHVEESGRNINSKILHIAGKVGYMARGIVWLIIGWMFAQAALHSNSSEAGDTSRAFSFLEKATYGTYLLAATGLGLICYGIFNFIRAKHERFYV